MTKNAGSDDRRERQAREAAALRENLRRRKAAQRLPPLDTVDGPPPDPPAIPDRRD